MAINSDFTISSNVSLTHQVNEKESSSSPITETTLSLFEKIRLQKPGVVRDWIATHHNSYVAHAVYTQSNVEAIIRSGKLTSAEEVLRCKGIAEYEKGATTGSRGKDQLPSLTESDYAEIKAIEAQFPNPRNLSLGLGLFVFKKTYEDEYDYACATFESLDANEKGPYTACVVNQLGGATSILFREKIEKLAEKYNTSPTAVTIAYDMRKAPDQQIDARLATLYSLFKEDMKRAKYIKKQVLQAFIRARQTAIFVSKLNGEIRTTKNVIAWAYGKVVVLSGAPKDKIGYKAATGERCLLAPWQNGGKFFSLKLADQNNLLIGPQSALKPYEKELQEQGIPFQYLENLTPEEAQYFQVPKT